MSYALPQSPAPATCTPPSHATRAELVVACRIPTPNANPHWGVKKKQRKTIRQALELQLGEWRPQLPCRVTLVRIASPRLDDDRNIASMFVVRDEVARWIARMPSEQLIRRKGQLVERATRAPDGPQSGITFEYGSEKAPNPPPNAELAAKLKALGKKAPKYEAVRITIESLPAGEER